MRKKIVKTFFLHLIRVLLGCVFVFSASAKLYAVDNLELYIYSQQLFSFDVSTVIARLIISVELAIGLLLITNLYFNITYKITLYLLLFFSLFLAFKLIVSGQDNCNCFGEIIILKPAASLFKNFVLVILLFIIKNNEDHQIRFRKIYFAVIVIFTLVFPSVLSPPDFIYKKVYKTSIDAEIGTRIHLSDTTLNISEGKKVLAFFSMGCKYCILAAHKISLIADRTNSHENINYILFGEERDLENFWVKSQSKRFKYAIIPFKELVHITDGRLPAVFFVENGFIKQKATYRDLTEELFLEFFRK